jgi:neutral ceramidase
MSDFTKRWPRQWGVVWTLVAGLGIGLLAGATAISSESPAVLQAGTAKVDITPAKPVMLAGYASRKELSQGIHDPLSARVVAFEQGGNRLVLVSTDVIGFSGGTSATVRKAIVEACGLQPSELLLTAIHTHSAPSVTLGPSAHPNNVEYTKTLEGQLVAAVRQALAHMGPVQIAVGSGSSPVGVNRREVVQNAAGKSRVQLGRNPSLLTDREVQVLRVSRADTGGVLAVVFAYATHSTALGPRNYLVSGDVHGLAEQFLEKHLAGGVIAPAFAGASGNIDPWFRVLPKFETAKGWIPEPVLMGTMLGEEVAHVLDGIKKPSAGGPIRTAFKTLVLPGKPRAKAGAAGGGKSPEFNLTVGRVGDVAVVGLGGEVFHEIGKAIKTASPFPHTLVITHCNGAAGYVPTKEAYPEGGYEVESSGFAPAAAGRVVEEVLRLLREL